MDTATYIAPDFSALSNDGVHTFFTEMQALVSLAQVNMLAAAAEIAARGATEVDGAATLGQWIGLVGRHDSGHAHTQARVAVALVDLPAIAAAFAAGELSFDQVAELTRFATDKTDAEWAERAPAMSLGQLRTEANRHSRDKKKDEKKKEKETGGGDPEPEPEPEPKPSLRFSHGRDGNERLTADLSPADMAAVRAALERQAERYGKDPETDLWAPRSERLADALVDLVTAAKPSNRGDRATTVVHVGWDTLARLLDGDHGDAYVDLPFAAGLAAETARAMACDGHLDVWVDNPYGATIGIGRTSPLWPSWLARKILHRDKTCRWPGCTNTIGLHIHHEKPWSRDGQTSTKGGFCLCSRHHRIRHKPGWKIHGDPDDILTFIRPDGTILDTSRPPLHPDIRERVTR